MRARTAGNLKAAQQALQKHTVTSVAAIAASVAATNCNGRVDSSGHAGRYWTRFILDRSRQCKATVDELARWSDTFDATTREPLDLCAVVCRCPTSLRLTIGATKDAEVSEALVIGFRQLQVLLPLSALSSNR